MSHCDPFDRTDTIRIQDLDRLAATLNVPAPERTPALWHWTSFLDGAPTASLGPDGHPRTGGLIPDPPFPRRMFAGGRMRFNEPLPIGVPIRRRATVGPAVAKQGRNGPLALITVQFVYLAEERVIATEEQDLVYLPAEPPVRSRGDERLAAFGNNFASCAAAPDRVQERREGENFLSHTESFSEPALFRFSALTFNSHRIHYDRTYATETEGHVDLVVHGPLLAIRLLELVRAARGDAAVATLSFRAKAPTYVNRPVAFTAALREHDATLVAKDGDRDLLELKASLR